MISAGNDIVALNVIDVQRTQSPAFYSKFITPTEFELYKSTKLSLVHFVWLLWSVKESAYKYLKRSDAGLVFSPSKLIVQQIITYTGDEIGQFNSSEETGIFYCGIIAHNSYELPYKSTIADEFIATCINDGNVHWGVQKIESEAYESQSKTIRQFASAYLTEAALFKSNNLRFEKHSAGYPVLFDDDKRTDIAVSFAHHGCYVSYSFQIPK